MESERPILISCFTPMGGWMRNSSQELVRSLEEDLPEALYPLISRLRFIHVLTDTDALPDTVKDFYSGTEPELCLHFGQSRRNRIAIERQAVNRLDYQHADAKGNTRSDLPVDPQGPPMFPANIENVERLAALLCEAEIPSYVSENCGTSLCNQLYYLSLKQVQERKLSTKVLFVHLPILPVQVIEQWHDAPCLTLELLRKAAELLLLSLRPSENQR